MDEVSVQRSSPWGNPYHIGRDGTREEVIEKFRKLAYSAGQKVWRNRVHTELADKVLVCCPEGLSCHREILYEIINTPLEYPNG